MTTSETPNGAEPVEMAGAVVGGYEQGLAPRVLRFAERVLYFAPVEAPTHMSEHFGHAEKHNDLSPVLADVRG